MALTKVESLFDKYHIHDLLWLYLFVMLSLDACGLVLGRYFLVHGLELAMIYIWSKRKPFEQVIFYFGIRVKSSYLPFVMVAFDLLVGQSLLDEILGIFIGHIYIYIKDILPVSTHKDYLKTPKFFEDFVKKYIANPGVQAHNNMQNE